MKQKEDEHRKYYHDGVEVPSCTTIVGLLGKPELIKWANYMGFMHIDTTELLTDKASYGTYCHKLFETYFTDGLICAGTNESYIPKDKYREIIFKFRMIELYFEKLGIEVISNELPLEGKLHGGTLDMLCYNRKKDCLMVFDLKTSKQIYQSHWIQLMGYIELLEEIYGLPVQEVGVILLSKPIKSPELVNIKTTKELWRERAVFNKLRDTYYYLNESEEIINKKLGELKC